MKIALINPGIPGALRKENLGLAYLAAALEAAGHRTVVLDEIAGQDVETGLDAFRPDVAALSCMTMFAPRAYALADRIRAKRGVPIVFGGVHPTALPQEALEHGDCVIRGEGEIALPKALDAGRLEGVIEGEPVEELDTLPLPARDRLDLGFYANAREGFAGFSYRNLGLITSRGCPYACEFCVNSKRNVPFRMHGVDRVIEEMRYLVGRHRIESVSFFDEHAAMRPERWSAICERMIREGFDTLRWECQMHAGRATPELLALMKRAGCIQVGIGFESGSQRILERMDKRATVEENLEAARRIREAGLRIRGCFIIGTPGETAEDIRETERFIKTARIDFVSVNFMTPYPGSLLFDRYADRVLASGVSWEHFTTGDADTVVCNDAMPAEEQKRLFERLRARRTFRNYTWAGMARRALKNPRYALHIASRLLRR